MGEPPDAFVRHYYDNETSIYKIILAKKEIEVATCLVIDVPASAAERILKGLSSLLPMGRLRHLKRARRRNDEVVAVLIGRKEDCDMKKDPLMNLVNLDKAYEVEVPQVPLRKRDEYSPQMTMFTKKGATMPAEYDADPIAPSKEQMVVTQKFMNRALELARHAHTDGNAANGGLLVDLNTGETFAEAHDEAFQPCKNKECDCKHQDTLVRPQSLRHTTMMLIDKRCSVNRTYYDEDIRNRYKLRKIGNRVTKKEKVEVDVDEENQREDSEKPYICVGLDLVIAREPCIMCAMAALHSRVRSIVFSVPNTRLGGLESRCNLHLHRDLNHHFDVHGGLFREKYSEMFPEGSD